jgi:Zn finger protein HypA/HybF involved in hydrogenase expression
MSGLEHLATPVTPRCKERGIAIIDELDKQEMEIKSLCDYYECYRCGDFTKKDKSLYCLIACQKCMAKRIDIIRIKSCHGKIHIIKPRFFSE